MSEFPHFHLSAVWVAGQSTCGHPIVAPCDEFGLTRGHKKAFSVFIDFYVKPRAQEGSAKRVNFVSLKLKWLPKEGSETKSCVSLCPSKKGKIR